MARAVGTVERRIFQVIVAVLALIPTGAGLSGVIEGPSFLEVAGSAPTDLDSHLRFLSGIFLAMGLAYYTCIPAIERRTARFRFLAALTIAGGLARLLSLILVGPPSGGHVAGLFMELGGVPFLVAWQTRIARGFGAPGTG